MDRVTYIASIVGFDGRRRHDRQHDQHYNPAELYRRATTMRLQDFIGKNPPFPAAATLHALGT